MSGFIVIKKLFSITIALGLIGSLIFSTPQKSTLASPSSPLFPSMVYYVSFNTVAPPSTESEWQFEKTHVDAGIGSAHFEGLKSRSAQTYLLKYTLLTPPEARLDTAEGEQEIRDLGWWCSQKGWDFEDAFLHYSDDTVVESANGKINIKGYPNGTATNRAESRLIQDVGYGRFYVYYQANQCVRDFKANRSLHQLQNPQAGYFWDGFFVDVFDGQVEDGPQRTSSGGHIIEYSNRLYSQITHQEYATDEAGMIQQVNQTVGDHLVLPNIANYINDRTKMISLAADGAVTEFLSLESQPYDAQGEKKIWDFAKDLNSAGKIFQYVQGSADFYYSNPQIANTFTASNYRNTEERHDMYSLAGYWMAKQGNLTWYGQKNKGWYIPLSSFWTKAVETNLGNPVGNYYLWQDTTGTTIRDSAGQNYRLYRRDYQKATIIFRPRYDWDWDTGDFSNLGAQSQKYDLGGTYRIVYQDGTLSQPITQISLALAEGVVLMKEVINKPQVDLTLTADKSAAVSGDIVIYTISYQNSGTQEAKNVIIEHPIPEGTNYLTGTASNNGQYDSVNNKLIWQIGNLGAHSPPAVLTFKVLVQ